MDVSRPASGLGCGRFRVVPRYNGLSSSLFQRLSFSDSGAIMLPSIVLVGDLLTIVLFMFLTGFGIPYHDETTSISWLTGFLIDTIPYLLIWIAIGRCSSGNGVPKRTLVPWRRLLFCWSATAVISGLINYLVVRFILLDQYTQVAKPTFPTTKIALIVIVGWVAIVGWRLLYVFVRWFSERERSKHLNRFLGFSGIVASAACVMGIAICLYSKIHYSSRIVAMSEVPRTRFGIVFGAGVDQYGAPSSLMAERVSTAAALYNSGVLERLFLSSGFSNGYSEAEIMMEMAVDLGVPRDAITIDTKGTDTFQTCMNAGVHIEGEDSALLVTHEYHLPRAMMICDSLGIDPIGVIAEQGYYPPQVLFSWRVREYFASVYAFLRLRF